MLIIIQNLDALVSLLFYGGVRLVLFDKIRKRYSVKKSEIYIGLSIERLPILCY